MVTISGVGFKTFSSLSELKLGDVDVRPAPVPSTDNVGNFATTLQIPQLNTGTQNVIAKVGGARGTTASGTFLVLASGHGPDPRCERSYGNGLRSRHSRGQPGAGMALQQRR